MKKFLLLLTASLFTVGLNAQITVPKYNFQTDADYTRCNDAILECCNWLIHTPLNDAAYMVDEVIGFIVEWSMGSPDVMIMIDEYFMPYLTTSSPLVAWHIAGASKYQLERGICAKSVEELRMSTLAGINTVLDYYTANKEFFGEDKRIDRMLKTREKGKMESFLAKKIIEELPEKE